MTAFELAEIEAAYFNERQHQKQKYSKRKPVKKANHKHDFSVPILVKVWETWCLPSGSNGGWRYYKARRCCYCEKISEVKWKPHIHIPPECQDWHIITKKSIF